MRVGLKDVVVKIEDEVATARCPYAGEVFKTRTDLQSVTLNRRSRGWPR